MKTFNFLLLSIFVTSVNAASTNYLTNTKSSANNEASLRNASTITTIVFGYQNTASTIDHKENSNYSNFYSINKSIEIEKNSLNIAALIEPFQNKQISPAFILRAGYGFGTDEGALSTAGFAYKEKYSGQHFGLGAGINYNGSAYGLKVQPFIQGEAIYSKAKYGLDYGNSTDPTTEFGIDYKVNETIFQSSAGIRFYDYDLALMSYFAVDYQTSLSQSTQGDGDHGGESFAVTNATVKSLPVGFTIGLGMFF